MHARARVCGRQILLTVEQRMSSEIYYQYNSSAANSTSGRDDQLTAAWDRTHRLVRSVCSRAEIFQKMSNLIL